MKFLFYLIGLAGAMFLGLRPGIEQRRPSITKFLTLGIIAAVVILALYPPIVGTFSDAVGAKAMHLPNQAVTVVVQADWGATDSLNCIQLSNSDIPSTITLRFTNDALREHAKALGSEPLLMKVVNTDSHSSFDITEVIGTKPAIILPYIPALEERARILFFHVPMSWVGFLAFIMTLIYSVQYLRTNAIQWETKAAASAAIGMMFCALAYVTGAVWAKFNWGKFFNWDTRELSVLILLLIYGAYFALRSSIDERDRRARLTSVYAIVSCVAALFLLFIIPRMTESLHPGSRGDSNSGPIISAQSDAINTTKAFIFALSLSGFTLLYYWILSIKVRLQNAEQKVDEYMNQS